MGRKCGSRRMSMMRVGQELCTESASDQCGFVEYLFGDVSESGRHLQLGVLLGVRALLPRTPFVVCGSQVGLVFDALSETAVVRVSQLFAPFVSWTYFNFR